MVQIVGFWFRVDPVIIGGLLVRHRLTWIFYDADGREYPNTQDRPPAGDDEHQAWLQLQADQFTIVTTPVNEAP